MQGFPLQKRQLAIGIWQLAKARGAFEFQFWHFWQSIWFPRFPICGYLRESAAIFALAFDFGFAKN